MIINIKVNGKNYSIETKPLKRLVDIIRDDIGLKGTKIGCGEGECGACSVLMNGKVVTSCLIPAFQADGSEIVTIEGLGTISEPGPLQKAFIEEGAIQCGFCTPGMVISAEELLRRKPYPTREEIKEALSGNLCRCTGYEKIFRAIEKVAFSKKL